MGKIEKRLFYLLFAVIFIGMTAFLWKRSFAVENHNPDILRSALKLENLKSGEKYFGVLGHSCLSAQISQIQDNKLKAVIIENSCIKP